MSVSFLQTPFENPLESSNSSDSPTPPVSFTSADGQIHTIHFLEKSFILKENNRIKTIFALSTKPFPSNFELPDRPDDPIEDEPPGNFLIGTELRGGGEKIRLTIDSLTTREGKAGLHIKSALIAALFEKHMETLIGGGDICVTALGKQWVSYAALGFVPTKQELERQLKRDLNRYENGNHPPASAAADGKDSSANQLLATSQSGLLLDNTCGLAPFDQTRNSSQLAHTHSSADLYRTLSRARLSFRQPSDEWNDTWNTTQLASSSGQQGLNSTHNSDPLGETHGFDPLSIEMILPPMSREFWSRSREIWGAFVFNRRINTKSLADLQKVYDKTMVLWQTNGCSPSVCPTVPGVTPVGFGEYTASSSILKKVQVFYTD